MVFSKFGIIAFIDEAIGHTKEKNKYELLFNQFLLEEAQKWQEVFSKDFFNIIWKIWLQKQSPKNNKRPQFLEKLSEKYAYRALAVSRLGLTSEEEGILLLKLDEKNPEQKPVKENGFFIKF